MDQMITVNRELLRQALDAFRKAYTPLREDLETILKAEKALRTALEQPVQEPVKLGSEWVPCLKLPVVVHVRNQRPGERHISTREGITPVKPDDLIMRGVSGEEYPIGRAIFDQTYTLEIAAPQAQQPPRIGTVTSVEQTLEQWEHDFRNPMTPEQQADWVKRERDFAARQAQQPAPVQEPTERKAPCARHCEAQAFKIEQRQLVRQIVDYMEIIAKQRVVMTRAWEVLGSMDVGTTSRTLGARVALREVLDRPVPAQQPRKAVKLTPEEVAAIVKEAAKGGPLRRDGSTSERIARAIEQAVWEKLGVTG